MGGDVSRFTVALVVVDKVTVWSVFISHNC